jgi:antitoxin component YwqK of YwqJK toxin-antitoxin module
MNDKNTTELIERYYRNGQLSTRVTLVNGKRTGAYESYFENGKLEFKGPCLNNERIGFWLIHSNKKNFYL